MSWFKNVSSTIGRVVNSTALIFKGGEIIKEVADAADAVKALRSNVAALVTKYSQTIAKEAPSDIKLILRDLDRVTEETADIAKVVGLDKAEETLRNWIKPDMYV